MKNLKVRKVESRLLTWDAKDKRRITLHLYKTKKGKWRSLGFYQVSRISKSNPAFKATYPLPYDWKPTGKLLQQLKESE